MPTIIPQIVGLLATIAYLLCFLQRKRSHIILINVISRVLYILQYFLLGAFAGAVLDMVGAVSATVAGQKHRSFVKKYQKVLHMAVNLLIIVAGGWTAVARRSPLDILPIIGVLLQTNSFWLNNERTIRRFSLVGQPFWLVYNLVFRAYGSVLGDLLAMGSMIIAMIKCRNDPNGEGKESA